MLSELFTLFTSFSLISSLPQHIRPSFLFILSSFPYFPLFHFTSILFYLFYVSLNYNKFYWILFTNFLILQHGKRMKVEQMTAIVEQKTLAVFLSITANYHCIHNLENSRQKTLLVVCCWLLTVMRIITIVLPRYLN